MENEKKKKCLCGWLCNLVKKCGLTFIIGIGFALICFIAINAMLGPTSTPEFCGTLCHQEMDQAYQSWKKSPHYMTRGGVQIKCIDCHAAPREQYFAHLYDKATAGTKDAYVHFFGEYNAEESRKRVLEHMTNETCMHCHKYIAEAPGDMQELHYDALNPEEGEEPEKCMNCHAELGNVGHVRDE